MSVERWHTQERKLFICFNHSGLGVVCYCSIALPTLTGTKANNFRDEYKQNEPPSVEDLLQDGHSLDVFESRRF